MMPWTGPSRQELRESPYLTLLYPSKVLDTLKLLNVTDVSPMYAPSGAKLTPELARQVCLRSDSRAYVTASIANAGNYYHIMLNALDCHSGRSLAKVERETNDRNQIVKTLGMAGHQLRRELGEPEESLKRFNTQLDTETSGSLEVLHAFSQALRLRSEQGDAAAIPEFKRTVELDPSFAIAYLSLGATYHNRREFSLAASNITTAFPLRSRLSQRSQWRVEAAYCTFVSGELEKANAIYAEWLRIFPADVYPHQGLSVSLRFLGQQEQAIFQAREAVRLSPSIQSYFVFMLPLIFMNRLEEAKAVFDEATAHGLDDWTLRRCRYLIAALQHDSAGMQEQISWALKRPEAKDWAIQQQGDAAVYRGQFRAALGFYSAMRNFSPNSAATLADTALREAEIGNPVRARQIADRALTANPTSEVRRELGLAFARAGAVKQAEELVEIIDKESPMDTVVQKYELPAIRAAIELHDERPERAVEILRSALTYDLALAPDERFVPLSPAYIRGLAYLKLRNGHEAATEFQKMVDHPGILRKFIIAPLSYLQLGRAQAMMGDEDAARNSYQDFLTLWKDADPDIPIYRQAKAEYAKLRATSN